MAAQGVTGDIAVIGMGCRFPGDARSPDEFFDMLLSGRSGLTEVPKERFNVDSWWHPSYDRHGTVICRGGYFLQEDVGFFDAPVSGTSQTIPYYCN
jgi:acyl transferase domain-containing protein